MKNGFARLGSILLMALVPAGCSSAQSAAPPPKEPPAPCAAVKTVLSLGASARVNSAVGGEGRPVQVRLYLLKNDAHLKNAKFEDIWERDREVLADDLLKTEQYTLFPGQEKRVVLDPPADTHSVAAVALFREPHDKSWFVTYDWDPPPKQAPCPKGDRTISVWLDGMQIRDGAGEAPDEDAATQSAGKQDDSDVSPSKSDRGH